MALTTKENYILLAQIKIRDVYWKVILQFTLKQE